MSYLHLLQVKAELLPDAFSDVWVYRLAVHASSILDAVMSALGDSDAAAYFAASDDSAATFLLETLSVSRLIGDTALGTADAIEAAAIEILGVGLPEATLTTVEADYLLTDTNQISVLNYEQGVPLWIGAARHLGLVQSSGLEDDATVANQLAYDYLLSKTLTRFGKSLEATKVLVLGISTYLYGRLGWMASPGADEYRAKEWAGKEEFVRGGGCDCGLYSTGVYTDVAVEIGLGLYSYRCDWGLASSLGFYAPWEDEGVAPPINESLTRWMIDPDYEDTRNEIGIHIDENLVRWWQAYEYCNVSKDGRSPVYVPAIRKLIAIFLEASSASRCEAMSAASQMTKVELPVMMFELGTYTVESFSASANAQADEDVDEEAHTPSTNSMFNRAFFGR